MTHPDQPAGCQHDLFTSGDHTMLAEALNYLSDAEDVAQTFDGDDAETLMYLLVDVRTALDTMQMLHSVDANIPDSKALREANEAEAAREADEWLARQPIGQSVADAGSGALSLW